MIRKVTLPAVLCVFALLLCFATPAAAQPEKGNSEILLFGSVSMDPSAAGESSSGNFFFNYGLFVGAKTQIGGGPSIFISTSQDITGNSSVDTTLGFNTFFRQYFGSAKVAPYLGGEFYMGDVEDAGNSFINIIGGVKNYFSERAAIDFKGAYGFSTQSGGGNLLQFSVGLTVLF